MSRSSHFSGSITATGMRSWYGETDSLGSSVRMANDGTSFAFDFGPIPIPTSMSGLHERLAVLACEQTWLFFAVFFPPFINVFGGNDAVPVREHRLERSALACSRCMSS